MKYKSLLKNKLNLIQLFFHIAEKYSSSLPADPQKSHGLHFDDIHTLEL